MQHNLIDKKFWDNKPASELAANTVYVIAPEIVKNAREIVIYIAFLALTSAGVIEVEGAHDPNFTGTWVSIGTITWSAASKCHKVSITGVHKALRVRVSTNLVGGPVDGHICAD